MSMSKPASGGAGDAPALLKLKAVDQEDLAVVSACLQDSALSLAQFSYDAQSRRFGFAASRFMWEIPPVKIDITGDVSDDAKPGLFPHDVYQRVNTRFWVEPVESVAGKGVDQQQRDQILALLALTAEPSAEGGLGTITLHFADGKGLRLSGKKLACYLEDFGEPWPTTRCPQHD